MSRLLAAASAISVFSSGCSWLFMTKAREPVAVPNTPVDCTSSRVAPGFDVAGVAYFVVNGIVILSRPDCGSASFGETCWESSAKAAGTILSVALAGTYLASAITGFKSADRCEQVKDLNAQCISGNESSCHQLNPSWAPGVGWPPPAPAETPGCFKDTDCKGSRICVSSMCVDPPRSEQPQRPKEKPPDACETTRDCDEGICIDGRCRK